MYGQLRYGAEFAVFLEKRGLNAVGDFAALKRRFEVYRLGRHPNNFESMELDQLMVFVDLFGLRLDETCPRGTIVDALVAVRRRSASTGANLLPLKRRSKEMAECLAEEETMESECTNLGAVGAENAILSHRISSSQLYEPSALPGQY